MLRSWPLAGVAALTLLAACAGDVTLERPLLGDDPPPVVLSEAAAIPPQPQADGNRFVSGWSPFRWRDRLHLLPGAGRGRISYVNLDDGARTLGLSFTELSQPGAATVRVSVEGRELGAFALAPALAVPLPAGLRQGRLAVDLRFDGIDSAAPPMLAAASVEPALAAGEARREGDDWLQSGNTLTELYAEGEGMSAVVGSFVPPPAPRSGQRFELTLEHDDGSEPARFAWTPEQGQRPRAISLRFSRCDGVLRVRLLARGEGPPGRWQGLRLRAIERKLQPLPTPPPPRLVLVYVFDALRADHVGYLGDRRGLTPTLDRLASEGRAFLAHRAVAPNTLPSTKALFTGETPLRAGASALPPDSPPTLAEQFHQAGFRTAAISANGYIGPEFGLDRGFDYRNDDVVLGGHQGDTAATINDSAARVHAATLAWLESLAPGERAFVYVHTVHPHVPYTPPDPWPVRYTAGIASEIDGLSQTLLDIRDQKRSPSEADKQRLKALYAANLAYNDSELAAFLAALDAIVPAADTLLVLTADHGEELFDHGGVLHGYTLHEELLRIPLVFWAPGRVRPERIAAMSDTLDLHRSLLAIAGIGMPAPARRLSFAAASSVPGGIAAATSARFKLVLAPRTRSGWGMGEGLGRSRDAEYFYALAGDPGETSNLAGDDSVEAGWLRARLGAWIERSAAREAGAETAAPALTPETAERLRALGYLQ